MTTVAAASAALERLAAALEPKEFITVLVTRTGRRPRLTVASRRTQATEDIYADDWFWWSWAERIAPVSDPMTAAHQVTTLLRPPEGERP